jgi:hypothetical protein
VKEAKGNDATLKPQSKFEWRPEDIIILTPEESAAAEAEYRELLAKMATQDARPSSDTSR